jgi:hypothetical protein
VLAARAAPAGGDPALRIYRGTGGGYGALLGQPVAPLVKDEPGPETAWVVRPADLNDLDPAAHTVRWVTREGSVAHVSTSVALAIAIDGRVVALAHTENLAAGAGTAHFTFLLPPALVHPGRNTLTVYLVRGPTTAPTLDPIPLTR